MVTFTSHKPRSFFLGVRDQFQQVPSDAEVMFLEKAESPVETFGGTTTMENITEALDEFDRLFNAGVASDAEILTLSRAFPDSPTYTQAAMGIPDESVMVVGGPASVELIDREGHLITTGALRTAFKKYMENFRTRNAMVLHSDVQVGWALPAYITKGGQIYKSDVNDKVLFFICEIRNDTKIADRVRDQIKQGKLKSYSIAGSATKVQNMTKGLMPYMQVDDMELAEVTVCEKGVNQGASFDLLKADMSEQTGKVSKEQCGYRESTPAELAMNIACGSCIYFNEQENSCETVSGDIEADDYCTLYKPEEDSPHTLDTEEEEGISIEIHLSKREDGSIDFTRSFLDLIKTKEDIPDHLSGDEIENLITRFKAPHSMEDSVLDDVIMPRNPDQDTEPTSAAEVPPEQQAKWDAEDEEESDIDKLQKFLTKFDPIPDGWFSNTGNALKTGLKPTPADVTVDTKWEVEEGDNITAMVKYLSDAQQQWTLNEEPPSFNWGPYGLQNKSNLGN